MGWQDDPIIERKPAWESDRIVAPAAGTARPSAKPAMVLRAGIAPPKLFTQADNPNSAGYYPLARLFSVGDRATYRILDGLTGVVEGEQTHRVTRVDVDNDTVEINDGGQLWDLMGNVVTHRGSSFNVPRQFSPSELFVGKKWTAVFATEDEDKRSSFDFQIVRREMVRVPAGEFFAFRAEGRGRVDFRDNSPKRGISQEETLWLLPYLNFPIKHERIGRNRKGKFKSNTRKHELVSLRQMALSVPL